MLTQQRLKELLNYCPESGLFVWNTTGTGRRLNKVAGSIKSNGYIVIRIDGRIFYAHRLALLYIYGVMPLKDIDHINSKRDDNRLENLRLSTRAENLQNQRRAKTSNNTSGLLGVSFDKYAGKFRAQIRLNYKSINIGLFACPYEAHQAYLNKKSELHPFKT